MEQYGAVPHSDFHRAAPSYLSLPLPEKQAWPALVALCVGFFMILLDQTIVSVATPALQAEMGATYNEVIWVTSGYLLSFAVPLLVTGRLGDKYGPKNVYAVGMALFTLSSLACGLAPSMLALILGRVAQGVGAALLTPQTMSVINRIFARDRLGAALGVWGATAGLAGLTGPIAGGVVTQLWGWQWVFFLNVPIGVISILAVLRFVPAIAPLSRKLDGISVALSVAALFLVVFAMQQGETADWAAWIFLCLGSGLALLALFVWEQQRAERRDREALVPLVLFRTRAFSVGNLGIFLMGFTVAGTALPYMLYFQQVHGLDPMRAGLMMVPQALLSGALSPWVGRLVDRADPARIAVLGFALLALGTGAMAALFVWAGPLWAALVALGVVGVGNAFVWAPNSRTTMGDLPRPLMGAGSGVYNTVRQVGSVCGAAFIGALMQIGLAHPSLGTGPALGYALLAAVAAMFLATLLTTAVVERSGTR